MRSLRPCLLIALTGFILTLAPSAPARCDVDNRPIVVFRVDDCSNTWRTHFNGLDSMSALDYGKQKHIPITWAVVTNLADNGYTNLSWTEIKDYLDEAGGEAASHSVNHRCMSSTQEYIDEIVNSKAAINSNPILNPNYPVLNYPCRTFLQPGSWGITQPDPTDTLHAYMDYFAELDNDIGRAIQANYEQSRAYLGQGWTIGTLHYRYGTSSTYGIDAHLNVTANDISVTLDVVAAAPGLVFTVTGHGVQETGGTTAYRIPADVLKALMDKLAQLRDEGKIRLMGMYDAFNTTPSSDLNHVPSPGFDILDPSNPPRARPWTLANGAQVIETGGIDNSRYVKIQGANSKVTSCYLMLTPGRYEMSWYQKVESGFSTSRPLYATLDNFGPPGYSNSQVPVSWVPYYNTQPDIWEKQTALVLIKEKLPTAYIFFTPSSSGGGFGVDNVSLVAAPVDPAVSPSNSTAVPQPGQCKILWDTPNDPSVTSIMIRYSSTFHPTTTTQGTLFGSVAAVPGSRQELTASINWNGLNPAYAHFCIFAVKGGGSFSPPDLAFVKRDGTAPQKPTITLFRLPDGSLEADWLSTDPESGIYVYLYAVGSGPGMDNYVQWTETTQTEVVFSNLPLGGPLYFSVKAENPFGAWSNPASVVVAQSLPMSLGEGDGTTIMVSGIVTAVFKDCYYIEQRERTRGLKIVGGGDNEVGQLVSVTGMLTTVNGERALLPY